MCRSMTMLLLVSHFTSYDAPVDKPLMREQRMELYKLPDYKPRR